MALLEPTFTMSRDGDAIVVRSRTLGMAWFGLLLLAGAVAGAFAVASVWTSLFVLLVFGGAGLYFSVPREFVTTFDPAANRVVRSIIYLNGMFQKRELYDFAQIESIGTEEFSDREGGLSLMPVLRTRSGETRHLAPMNTSQTAIDPVLKTIAAQTGLPVLARHGLLSGRR